MCRCPWPRVGGIVAAVLLAFIVGIPSLRLRADYLAIATVAASEVVRYLAMNLPDLTGGPLGSIGMLGPGQVAMYNGAWLALINFLTPVGILRAMRQSPRWYGFSQCSPSPRSPISSGRPGAAS